MKFSDSADPSKGLVITYSGGTYCGSGRRITVINISCNEKIKPGIK